MESNNILQAIRDKKLILALYGRIQNFKNKMKVDYRKHLRKKNIREVATLICIFLIFFGGFVSFYIKDYTSILTIIFSILILFGSFIISIILNIGLSKMITSIYNKKIISKHNVKFTSVNKNRLGIDLTQNPLFYVKLNKLEEELVDEESYYINNFNFFSSKRTKEGLLLNIYLKAIKRSSLETLEENFDYISNEFNRTFKKEDYEILLNVLKNVISANKALKAKEESLKNENLKDSEEPKDSKEKTKEELIEEEHLEFLKSLDLEDLIPQQKF